MFLVYLAVVSSSISFLTGIMVVGSGSQFQYTRRDILRGRCDAVLYIWITFSSIFALAHFMSILDYGIMYNWEYRSAWTPRWMLIHTFVAVLLTTAHIFIHHDLKRGTSGSTFLWGRNAG